jgi:hypothetical protein
MKMKMAAVAALLVLPATAFGATSIGLVHDGDGLPYFTGQVPGGLLTLDVMVSFDYGQIYTVSGGLYLDPDPDNKASDITINSVDYAGFPPWSYAYATPVGSNLSQHLDFGKLNFGGTEESLADAGGQKYATIVLNVGLLPPGVYQIKIGDSLSGKLADTGSGKGYWASINAPTGHTGEAWPFDSDGEFTLTLTAPCEALSITSAVSRKTHGSAGTFDIAAGSIECRSTRITKIVTVFDQSIVRLGSDNTDVSITSGTFTATSSIVVSTTTNPNDTVTVNLTDNSVTDKVPFRIWYPGIAAECDHDYTGAALVKCWRVLRGDYDGSGKVQTIDVSGVSGKIGHTFSQSNFRADYDANGKFETLDVSGTSGKIPNSCAVCP